MHPSESDRFREKVDGFLHQVLAEADPVLRARLLGKAVYWNQQAHKLAAGPPPPPSRRAPSHWS